MKKIGVIFGGMSTENEVSLKSGKSVLNNLDKEKYDIYPIYISKEGKWYEYDDMLEISNIMEYLKNFDVIFPVLHGLYGEDGTIQSLLELIKVPYIGCKVLASSIGLDKVYSKIIFEKANINQAKYIYVKKREENKYIYVDKELNEIDEDLTSIMNIVKTNIGYPVFVKPSNLGSSIGINKAIDDEELIYALNQASMYDSKILIEEEIKGKEVECAVIGDKFNVEASRVGEILSADEFYTYDAKYENKESKTVIPANISDKKVEEIRELAKKAFKSIDGTGLSRVDFFIEEGTEKVYINEINTMPGFTDISMYSKLMDDYGYSYSELLDKLIEIS